MTQSTEPFQIRAYVREGVTRIPVDVRKHFIKEVADNLELKIEWYTGTKRANSAVRERNMWAEQLRCDEIGLIHSLPVLRLTRKQIGGADPKGDFAGLMASAGGSYLMEAATGLTSKNKRKWKLAVSAVTEKPPPGAKALTTAQASKLAKDGWETRNKGVTFTWKSEARV